MKEKLQSAIREAGELDLTRDEVTVGEWIRTWFEVYSRPNIRPRTAEYYQRFIERNIIPALGDIKLKKLTSRKIQKLYNDLKDHGRVRAAQKEENPGLSPAYIRGLHTMLRACLDRAVKERLILRNPAEDCVLPKLQKREMKILDPEHIGAYLKAAEDRGALPMFRFALTPRRRLAANGE